MAQVETLVYCGSMESLRKTLSLQQCNGKDEQEDEQAWEDLYGHVRGGLCSMKELGMYDDS